MDLPIGSLSGTMDLPADLDFYEGPISSEFLGFDPNKHVFYHDDLVDLLPDCSDSLEVPELINKQKDRTVQPASSTTSKTEIKLKHLKTKSKNTPKARPKKILSARSNIDKLTPLIKSRKISVPTKIKALKHQALLRGQKAPICVNKADSVDIDTSLGEVELDCKRIAAEFINSYQHLPDEQIRSDGAYSETDSAFGSVRTGESSCVDSLSSCEENDALMPNSMYIPYDNSNVTSVCDQFTPNVKSPKKSSTKRNKNILTINIDGKTKTQHCNYPGCAKSYFRKEELKRHIKVTHKKLRPHVCDICQKSFGRRDHLTQHKRTHMDKIGRRSIRMLGN